MSYSRQSLDWSRYLVAALAVVGFAGCSQTSNPAAPAALTSAVGQESGAVKGEPGVGPDLAVGAGRHGAVYGQGGGAQNADGDIRIQPAAIVTRSVPARWGSTAPTLHWSRAR